MSACITRFLLVLAGLVQVQAFVPLSPALPSRARLPPVSHSVTMQLNPWGKDETSRFRDMLIRAVRTNNSKGKQVMAHEETDTRDESEVQVPVAPEETDSRDESEVPEYLTRQLNSLFPKVARMALFDNLKSVPSLVLAAHSSAGSSATVGGCMRSKVEKYQHMSPDAKKKVYEDMMFVSDLATVTLGAVILMLLVGDGVKIFHEFRVLYPDLQFQRELLQYQADLSMSSL
mmetsp:Transcript_10254/g.14724  ORF Transcript_10254/g.14724 Transcript_10254/m.14724 type:complete len:231 (+) Transcript_10254:16-708(+)